MTLDELDIDENAEITGYCGLSGNLKAKFLALGLLSGTAVRIVNVALLGDPIEISVRGYALSLRKDEAKCIKIKKLAPST